MTSAAAARKSDRASGLRSDAGFSVCHPRCVASCATALAVSLRPRPAGRSGCVRTSGIWWPAEAIASSARAAKGGVPAKATRKARAASGGLALAFLELRANAVLLEVGEQLDEDLAVQVVHLVLDACREEARGVQGET